MGRFLIFLILAFFTRFVRAEVTIEWVASADSRHGAVLVNGLSSAAIEMLQSLDSVHLAACFKFYVMNAGESNANSLPAMFGTCTIEEKRFVFRPRFALLPGQAYCAEFHIPDYDMVSVRTEILLPKRPTQATTRVTEIYPSHTKLPQNLLKFYVHFSAPMEQGNVFRFINISRSNGQKLELPFLELAEELWDSSGTRLTLLLDPARIKRGLVPREQEGAIFVIGENYKLTIQSQWHDAGGMPLIQSAEKRFTVIEEDFVQPNPLNWSVESSRSQIQISFPEPLDHAMLEHRLVVMDSTGKRIPGRVEIARQEMQWMFLPDKKFSPGRLTLKIDTLLEDLAGNSIQRPFEVDLSKPLDAGRPIDSLQVVIDDK